MPNYGMPIDQPQFNLTPAQDVPVSTIQERSLPMSPMPGEAVPMQYAGQVAPRQVVVTRPVGQAAPPVQNTVRVANNNYNVAGGAPYSADTGIAPPIVHRSPYTTLTHMTSPYTGQVFTLQGYPSRSPHMIYGDLFDTTAPYMNALIPWIMGGMQAQGQVQSQAKTSGGGGGTAKVPRTPKPSADVYDDSNLMDGFLRGAQSDTSKVGDIGLGSSTSTGTSRSFDTSNELSPLGLGALGASAMAGLNALYEWASGKFSSTPPASGTPRSGGIVPVSGGPAPVQSGPAWAQRAGNLSEQAVGRGVKPPTPQAPPYLQRAGNLADQAASPQASGPASTSPVRRVPNPRNVSQGSPSYNPLAQRASQVPTAAQGASRGVNIPGFGRQPLPQGSFNVPGLTGLGAAANVAGTLSASVLAQRDAEKYGINPSYAMWLRTTYGAGVDDLIARGVFSLDRSGKLIPGPNANLPWN